MSVAETSGCRNIRALTWAPSRSQAPKGGYELPVAKLTSFEGQVVDKQGKPLAGATVKPTWFLEIDETCDPSG